MINWNEMSKLAWQIRAHARLMPDGKTKVGCVAIDVSGIVGMGCNVQHKFRCDLHAEVVALGGMIALGGVKAVALLVVAEREKFTPCGACVGWIMELGGSDCVVGFQPAPGAEILMLKASDLMPHYPA